MIKRRSIGTWEAKSSFQEITGWMESNSHSSTWFKHLDWKSFLENFMPRKTKTRDINIRICTILLFKKTCTKCVCCISKLCKNTSPAYSPPNCTNILSHNSSLLTISHYEITAGWFCRLRWQFLWFPSFVGSACSVWAEEVHGQKRTRWDPVHPTQRHPLSKTALSNGTFCDTSGYEASQCVTISFRMENRYPNRQTLTNWLKRSNRLKMRMQTKYQTSSCCLAGALGSLINPEATW